MLSPTSAPSSRLGFLSSFFNPCCEDVRFLSLLLFIVCASLYLSPSPAISLILRSACSFALLSMCRGSMECHSAFSLLFYPFSHFLGLDIDSDGVSWRWT
ncbi:hypothetical protein BDN70DRAFT_406455 [Pholiota conissans]|uniref:Uncharacterized protein n=1 Tax=Pholiota conissans TaxID=109636 RepID=A0A9P5YPN3_9AGAR|nr:hypothetical protein BDN70DRAFT_406455 [Pholiota conissans]